MKKTPFSIVLIFSIMYSSFGQISNVEVLLKGYPNLQSDKTPLLHDFNNDGLLDLMQVLSGQYEYDQDDNQNGVYVYYQDTLNGVVNFTPEFLLEESQFNQTILINEFNLLDYDLDGDEDVLIPLSMYPTKFAVFINDGDAFNLETSLTPFFNNQDLEIIKTIDLNGDGLREIVYVDESVDNTYIHFFHNPELDDLLVTTKHVRYFDFHDIDLDGDIDIVGPTFEGSIDTLWLFQSNNSESYTSYAIDDNTCFSYHNSYLNDIDGDGDIDFIYSCGSITYAIDGFEIGLINQKREIFPRQFNAVFDFNQDGFLDLYDDMLLTEEDSLFLNDGTGSFSFSPEKIQRIPLETGYLNSEIHENQNIEIRYFINNNLLEVLELSPNGHHLERYSLNQHLLKSIDQVEVTDINNDGFQDLIIASRWANSIFLFEGLPNKNYKPVKTITDNDVGVNDFQLIDVNGDDKLDFLYSCVWDGTIVLRTGNGDGTFSEKQILDEDVYLMHGSVVADFEGDGFPDVIYSSNFREELYMMRNHNGLFQSPELIESEREFSQIYQMDGDGDGDLDFAVSISGGGYLFYLNNGQGNFTTGNFTTYFNPRGPKIDFDNDGINEFIFNTSNGYNIFKFNEQLNDIELWKIFDVGDGFNGALGFIDIDGDGYLDFIQEDGSDGIIFKNVENNELEFHSYFSETFDIPFLEKYNVGEDVHSMDLDGDGDIDMLYQDNGHIYIIKDLVGDEPLSSNEVKNNRLKIYPNPTSGVLFFENSSDFDRIILFSISGQKILESTNLTNLDLSTVKNGIYIIRAEGINGTYLEYVVKID